MGDDYITPYADDNIVTDDDIVTTSGTGEGFTPGVTPPGGGDGSGGFWGS